MNNGAHFSTARWRIALDDDVNVIDPSGVILIPRARKARALLAYLSVERAHLASRRAIIELLWSDRGTEQARASLRQCLFELKSEVPDLVIATDTEIALAPDVRVTEARHMVLAKLADLDPAFERWRGELLRRPQLPAPPTWHRIYWLAGVGAAALLGAALWLWWPQQKPLVPTVAVATANLSAGPATAFLEAAKRAMPGRSLRVRGGAGSTAGADWIVRATRTNSGISVAITTPDGQQLWTVQRPFGDNALMSSADLGRQAGEAMLCAARAPAGPPRDTDLLSLLLDVCGKISRRDDTADALVAARRLTMVYPDFAYGHGILAMNLVSAAAPNEIAEQNDNEAEREARRSLALDGRTGEAWMALGVLARDKQDYRSAETLFRKGLAAQPDHAALNNFLAGVLGAVGRTDEALIYARRAAALDPASPVKLASVVALLSQTGRPRAALALLDQADAERGPSRFLARARINVLEQAGDLSGVRMLLGQIQGTGAFLEPAEAADIRSVFTASGNTAPIAADMQERLATYENGMTVLLRALIGKGRINDAVALVRSGKVDPPSLFGPEMRPLWRDARFPDIARGLKLWPYWEETGRWPDICNDPSRSWRCGGVKSPSILH